MAYNIMRTTRITQYRFATYLRLTAFIAVLLSVAPAAQCQTTDKTRAEVIANVMAQFKRDVIANGFIRQALEQVRERNPSVPQPTWDAVTVEVQSAWIELNFAPGQPIDLVYRKMLAPMSTEELTDISKMMSTSTFIKLTHALANKELQETSMKEVIRHLPKLGSLITTIGKSHGIEALLLQ